ncbi:M24 family metallopeptidase [Salinicoccus roseus]|uniref:M24 family metallopeptidase n=1 Tax=Salinicoccus roseus TaxID=45670 RepID=UPI001EF495A9|nr:Xaa-Pro peptidase family protein [Salinicoccus roseus]MCG7332427.1 Xaa-Pro peptidase family protein [Salinicoccus roseus]
MPIDYSQRKRTLMERLEKETLDIALITDPTNIFYYTGFYADPHERYMSLVIDAGNRKSALFLPALDEELAKASAEVDAIHPISDEMNPFDIVKGAIQKNISKIGIEMDVMTVSHQNGLKSIYSGAEYTDITQEINHMRTFKTPSEVDGLRHAVDIIEKVLEEGLATIHEGMTEAALTAEFEYLKKRHGAAGPSFSTMVLSGEKSAMPHGKPGERKLQEGDFLLIDFGVITNERYCSDITRTFVIGEPTAKQKEIYETVQKSTQAGVDAVRSDVPLKSFDIAAREVIESAGYGEYFNNREGHGLGIEVHEAPSIHHENEQLSAPGMVFTIEPGIYIPGFGGVRIEEEVYINEDGEPEVLTSFPRNLRSIEIK